MKAKRVKAWACGYCGKTFRGDEHGKARANACCLCRECGVNPGKHIATDRSMCGECAASRELHSALDSLEHAKARLKKAQSGHVR